MNYELLKTCNFIRVNGEIFETIGKFPEVFAPEFYVYYLKPEGLTRGVHQITNNKIEEIITEEDYPEVYL